MKSNSQRVKLPAISGVSTRRKAVIVLCQVKEYVDKALEEEQAEREAKEAAAASAVDAEVVADSGAMQSARVDIPVCIAAVI